MKIKKKFKYITTSIALLTIISASLFMTYKKIKQKESNYKIVKIVGGLGNQMFQYAFSLALANESNCNVYYDLSFYNEENQSQFPSIEEMLENQELAQHNAKRKFCLKNFNINYQLADNERIKSCASEISESVVKQKGIAGFNNGQHEHICGYFETIELFDYEKYRDIFNRVFTIKVDMDEKNKDMMNKIKLLNSVSIHIRRTDHGICGFTNLKYYDKAVNYIVSKIENPHFFIFSDDINWVKENFKLDYPNTIVDINNDDTNYFDFELMKNCKHNIIANSTFSWWAAWLNPNKEKIVTAPTPWFQENERKDMIPKDWIKIREE